MEDKLIKSEYKGFPFPIRCQKCNKEVGVFYIVATTIVEAISIAMTPSYTNKMIDLLREHFTKIHNE